MMRGAFRTRRGVRALVWMVMLASSVHGRPLLAHEMGTIKLSAPQVVVGGSLTLTGSKFTKDHPLKLELRGALATIQLGEVRSDAEGAFTLTITLPADARAGAYSLVVIAEDGDVVARAGLPVLAAAAASEAHAAVGHSLAGMAQGQGTAEMMPLPRNGTASQSAAVLGLLALCVVGGSLMVRRARLAEGDEGGRRGVRKHLAGGLVVVALAGFAEARLPDGPAVPTRQAGPEANAVAPAHDMATMPPAASTPPDMSAMDHASMTEQVPAGARPTSGADHSGMAGMTSPRAGGAATVDHSAMPGMQPAGGAARGSPPAVDHSAMPGMAAPTQPAGGTDQTTTEKLRRLATLLVRDSAVQQRIQADTALRSGWQDEEVRGLLAPR